MLTYWETLIARKSNITVSDSYAKLWGKKSQSGYTVETYIGTLPATLRTVRGYLERYKIYGNTVQDGTPTPENPIVPSECGERTGNVMPAGEQKTVVSNGVTFSSDGNGRYHISGTATAYVSTRFNLLSPFTTPISVSNGGQGTLSFFNTQSSNSVTFEFYNGTTMVDDWRQFPIGKTSTAYNAAGNKYVDSVMIAVNSGATVDITITPEFTNDGVLPSEFEPYGYKLPLTANGVEYPIYLGESQTTRRIKKLVLTGNEAIEMKSGNAKWYIPIADMKKLTNKSVIEWYCSHYQAVANKASWTSYDYMISWSTEDTGSSIGLRIRDIDFLTGVIVDDFKSYLAQQYAAGTPVTIWYVLAEPETGIVNEPLMKIGDYADTIDSTQSTVRIPTSAGETTISWAGEGLAPSEVEFVYKVKG